MVQHFQLSAVVRLSECRKNTVFIHGRGNILVANDALKRLLGLSVRLFPVHARPTARAERTRQMLQILKKLQCLTDPSILTMICKRFIYVLTRNRSNDNQVLVYNRPFQLSTFPATASRVCERDPSAPVHSKVGAPEGKLEIATICNGDPKLTFDFFAHCILPTIVNISELSFLVSFYTVINVSFTRCQPRSGYFRIPFDLFS